MSFNKKATEDTEKKEGLRSSSQPSAFPASSSLKDDSAQKDPEQTESQEKSNPISKTSVAKKNWPRAILHLDMDAFYVNVHILDNSEDAERPLAIGGQPDQRGVVASASYEARAKGVRSAMPMSTAVRLCPNLKIAPANWKRIRECSKQVMSILESYGPVEQMSVDEAYVDLSAWDNPEEKAAEIKAAVKTKTSLPCSVGLSSSKLVAKVASDHDKPEGFTIVPPGEEAAFLAPLPTRAIHGIGPRTAEKLAKLNIHTCQQLALADLGLLQGALGSQGASLKERARGVDGRTVKSDRGMAKSISQEWTFSQDVSDPERLRIQLQKMAERVAQSLQKRQLVAHTVTVKFRWADFTTFTRQRSLEVGIDDAETIYTVAEAIWAEHWPPGQKMRLLGVGVSKIEAVQVRQLGFNFPK
ncbi:DNA polymerase IV [Candidatus Leptofilum sp.]|uniref:DNA polymerase IV n=1 Tax=Candidatus Leptofilum sp. TaxID=3241576 RepID=UPI003B5B0E45